MEINQTYVTYLYLLVVVFSAVCVGATSVALIALGRGWFIATGRWSSSHGNILTLTRYYGFSIFGWYPLVNVRFRYWVRVPQYREGLLHEIEVAQLEAVSTGIGVQGSQPLSRVYHQGIRTGLEVAMARLSGREPRIEQPDSVYAAVETEMLGKLMHDSRLHNRRSHQHNDGNTGMSY